MSPALEDYVERDSMLLNLSSGKRVLHLGCVGFTDCTVEEKIRLARQSLHQKLSSVSDCIGVDLDDVSILQLKERGIFNNVFVGDVEQLGELPADLGLFDVVIAGDIIEHLSNPGKMLDGLGRWLKPDGIVVVSTPNAFSLPAYLRWIRGCFHEGAQHVVCFNPITLSQLAARHGFEVVRALSCYQSTAKQTHGIAFTLGRRLFKQFPQLGGTLLFVFRRARN